MIKTSVFVFVLLNIYQVFGSNGDLSSFYQNCLKSCIKGNCTADGASFAPLRKGRQDVWSKLLLWTCKEECQYFCMWLTVRGFHERGYDTPKFHGKWPFVKVFGIQEPASVLASALNLICHLYMYTEIRRKFNSKSTPLVLFWHVFVLVCINGWIWSIIFHTRDNGFTEFMDYACALSMVMALFIAAVIRVLHRKRKLTVFVLTMPLLYYLEHVRYLYSGRIDYDYNMKVNVFFGVLGSLIWLAWSCFQYAAGRRYVWRMAAFTLLSGATLSLELLDFPPQRGWDAHALWHLSTAPLPLLFYRFVIDDLTYLKTHVILDKGVSKLD